MHDVKEDRVVFYSPQQYYGGRYRQSTRKNYLSGKDMEKIPCLMCMDVVQR